MSKGSSIPASLRPFHYQAVVVIGSARKFFSKPLATPIKGFTTGDRITFAHRRSLASPTRPAVLSSPHKYISTCFVPLECCKESILALGTHDLFVRTRPRTAPRCPFTLFQVTGHTSHSAV